MNAGEAAGDAGTILSVDAIDEFRSEVNPKAEYGWKPGGVINVGIKSGTNSIHGTAYAYGRDTAFDARNYFNNSMDRRPVNCKPSSPWGWSSSAPRRWPDQERQALLFPKL